MIIIIAPVIFAFLLGAFIFCVLPRAGFARRTLSVGIFLALISIVYGGAIELLGRAKPLRFEWRDAAKVQVLSAVPIENEAIYVWLAMPESQEPRAYVLPWSVETAQQLQDAMTKAESDGTRVEMALGRFEAGLDPREPLFYALPQPPMPEKNYADTDPLVYGEPQDPPVTTGDMYQMADEWLKLLQGAR